MTNATDDDNKRLDFELFNRTFGQTLRAWRLIWSLQVYMQYGSSLAHVHILSSTYKTAVEIINQPDYGTPEERDSVAQTLPTKVAAAAAYTIQDAHAAANAACVVFAHSMLDGAIEDYCKVSALFSLNDWKEYVQQEKVTLAEVGDATFDELLRNAVLGYLKRFGNKSLPNKIEVLQSICKPGAIEILKDYRFDGDRLRRFDLLRHNIIHNEGFGAEIDNIEKDLQYIERTSIYLSALITHRYGLQIDPRAMNVAIA
jgi:hypothetical protein